MKQSFFARHALLILMVVFFTVPFGLRAARMSLQGMKNDVRDWLPSTYGETGELQWFKEHFLGEQFVVVSWQGCYGNAGSPEEIARYKLFLEKVLPSVPPSQARAEYLASLPDNAGEPVASENPEQQVSFEDAIPVEASAVDKKTLFNRVMTEAEVPIERPNHIGDDLGLYTPHDQPNLYYNWGGAKEKWLKGAGNLWYYITPEGDLYRWNGADAPVAAVGRWVWRHVVGEQLSGERVKSFGTLDGPWYYENPRRLRAQLFKTVSSGPGVLHTLVNEKDGLLLRGNTNPGDEADLRTEAMRRLRGSLFGDADPKTGKEHTCLFLTLSDAAKRDLHQVCGRAMLGKPLGRLYEIGSESGIKMDELRLGGPPIDNVAIDEEGTITLVRLVGLSVLLGLGLSYACFRSFSATFMVFFVGGVSAIMSVAFVWWLGSSMDAIMMSMPSLVYVLGLSGGVHLMNYYHQAVEEHGVEGACEHAVAHAWKPALLCNITTAIGLISLYTSEIVPIRKFGTFSAIAVMVMLLIVFAYLPAALQLWPQLPKRRTSADEESWLEKAMSGFWHVTGKWIIDHHAFVAITSTLIIVVVGYGVTRIQTSVNLLKMFDASAKIIGDYAWLEKNLGRLVPMEVVVKVNNASLATPVAEVSRNAAAPENITVAKEQAIQELVKLNFLSRMEMTAKVQQAVEMQFGPEGSNEVGRAMSAATFAPVLPTASNDLSTFSRRRAMNKLLEEHRSEYLESDYLRNEKGGDAELWRISVRLAASEKVDYGAFVHDLKLVVAPVLKAYEDREQVIRHIAEKKFAAAQANATEALEPAAIAKVVNPALASVLILGSEHVAEQPLMHRSKAVRVRMLADLLETSRLKVVSPTDAEANLTPEKLAAYDCVILGENASADMRATVHSHSKQVIDLADPVKPPVTSLSAVYTGVVPIVYKAQRALLESLIQSTFWSFITITPLMMLVSRSFAAGAVAMLPNVLPVFIVFGAMGWLKIEVDVGSMMTASIALGVAVDDTIHYLSWFRVELDKLQDRKAAILSTYTKCATPTFQAALISGLGLSIFVFSTFTPTQRFGYLMLTILWTGVIAELIYFPSLLAGPLGLAFKPRPLSPDAANSHGVEAHVVNSVEIENPVPEAAATSDAEVVKFPLIKPHLVRHDQPHVSNKKRKS